MWRVGTSLTRSGSGVLNRVSFLALEGCVHRHTLMTKPSGVLCAAINTECTILVAVPVTGTEGSSLPQEQDSCLASALGLPAHPLHCATKPHPPAGQCCRGKQGCFGFKLFTSEAGVGQWEFLKTSARSGGWVLLTVSYFCDEEHYCSLHYIIVCPPNCWKILITFHKPLYSVGQHSKQVFFRCQRVCTG